jgi:hypothetical protein
MATLRQSATFSDFRSLKSNPYRQCSKSPSKSGKTAYQLPIAYLLYKEEKERNRGVQTMKHVYSREYAHVGLSGNRDWTA